MDRTVLPIPQPHTHRSPLSMRATQRHRRASGKSADGAPNVLIILLDDMGFGQSSAFGGPVNMPTLDALAKQGLRYNEFHTTAICSPTRAALLTGRNHHMNNMGAITEIATAFPGNTGVRPNSIAPIAEMLRLNGYSTAAFGKWHETPPWQVSPSGPTDLWPTRSGFDKSTVPSAGETDEYSPTLYEDMSRIEIPRNPNYHLMTDMTDKAIGWVEYLKSRTRTSRSSFNSLPAPCMRRSTCRRSGSTSIAASSTRAGTNCARRRWRGRSSSASSRRTPSSRQSRRPSRIGKAFSRRKATFARQMEVFAGFGEYTDREIGRLIEAIRSMGQLDNTLVFYIVGDNGASAEGGMNGLVNEFSYFNAVPETVADMLKHIDELGGPLTYPHYAAGWAVAGDTPFTWTKQIAGSYGGTRNPLVLFWPKRITAKGEVRPQWHHVIDIAPTILEAAGLPEPRVVDGTAQTPIQGVSMIYSFADPAAASRHHTQYFEILGNRGIYHDGWLAGTVHRAPWNMSRAPPWRTTSGSSTTRAMTSA